MKILLVHNQYQWPGGEDVVFEQERQLLSRAGHRVPVYQRSNIELEGHFPGQQLAMARNIIWAATEFARAQFVEREVPGIEQPSHD